MLICWSQLVFIASLLIIVNTIYILDYEINKSLLNDQMLLISNLRFKVGNVSKKNPHPTLEEFPLTHYLKP